MEKTLEKMARAAYERPVAGMDSDRRFDDLMSFEKELLINDARAAVEAIREPVIAVITAMNAESYPDSGSYSRWQAGVDAILNEK